MTTSRDLRLARRHFLGSMLAAGAAPMVIPARLLGDEAPSRILNIACVGIGNRGGGISLSIGRDARTKVVAVCDVDLDHERVSAVLGAFPDARRFHDFRRMFDEMAGDIDAVVIGTPDHTHFPIAMLAMSLGKHVYVEKPLANTFREAELLMAAERKHKVAAQMGNQGHSGGNYYQFKAFAEAGVMDGVNKVVGYMNGVRRWHGWGDVQGYPEGKPLPGSLHWDLWNTVAEARPYSPRFHPGNWRGWYRYGMGALGDWGPHILDTAHRFLELGLPARIEPLHLRQPNAFIFPLETTLKFSFPARGARPPVEVFWYDGVNNRPEAPEELEGRDPGGAGKFILGGKYPFAGGSHNQTLRVIPEALRREVQAGLPTFGSGSSHHQNFVLSALGEQTCNSPFGVAGELCQVFNLGVIAIELGEPLDFDPATKRFVNNDRANALLAGPPPPAGWESLYRV